MAQNSRRFGARTLTFVLVAGLALGVGFPRLFTGRATAPAAALSPNAPADGGVIELSAEAQKNAKVEVVSVRTATLPLTLDVTGRVTPPESRVAHIRPLAQGLVEQVHVTVGQRVIAGQPLATYDNVVLGELIGEYLSEADAEGQSRDENESERAGTEAP